MKQKMSYYQEQREDLNEQAQKGAKALYQQHSCKPTKQVARQKKIVSVLGCSCLKMGEEQ